MRDFRKILDVLKNEKLSQVLSLVLTFLAIAAGIATYVVFSNTPPGEKSSRIIPLVYVDIILLLLLAVVIVSMSTCKARRLNRQLLEPLLEHYSPNRLSNLACNRPMSLSNIL